MKQVKVFLATGLFIVATSNFSLVQCSKEDTKADVPAAVSKPAQPAVEPGAQPAEQSAVKQAEKKLIVYYFYTTYRCYSCNLIESLTKQAVETGFRDQIDKGLIELRSVNVESPGNDRYVKEYKLYTKSVVLSRLEDGKEVKWKNLDQVWTLLRDQKKFIDYIQKEVTSHLQG